MLKIKKMVTMCLVLFMALGLFGCRNTPSEEESNLYNLTIIYETEEGNHTQNLIVDKDYDLNSFRPTINGYIFYGWYMNNDWYRRIEDMTQLLRESSDEAVKDKKLVLYGRLSRKDYTITVDLYGQISKLERRIHSTISSQELDKNVSIRGFSSVQWSLSPTTYEPVPTSMLTSDMTVYGIGKMLDGFVNIPIYLNDEIIARRIVKKGETIDLTSIDTSDLFNPDGYISTELRGYRVRGTDLISKEKLLIEDDCEIETVYYSFETDYFQKNEGNGYSVTFHSNGEIDPSGPAKEYTEEQKEDIISKFGFDPFSHKTCYIFYYIDKETNRIIGTTGPKYIDDHVDGYKIPLQDIVEMADELDSDNVFYQTREYSSYNFEFYASRSLSSPISEYNDNKNNLNGGSSYSFNPIYLPKEDEPLTEEYPYGYFMPALYSLNTIFVTMERK